MKRQSFMIRLFATCFFAGILASCSDSLDKSPSFFSQKPLVNPAWKALDAFASATPAHDLTVIGGIITPTSCTLYIRMNWCNGKTDLRWGEQPMQYDFMEQINIPPACPCSTSTLQQFTKVITGLAPNTTYYLNIYGLWLNAGVYPFEWDVYDTIVTPKE